jgi:hypothetical protein
MRLSFLICSALSGASAEVDGILGLHRPARVPQHAIDPIARKLFGILVRHRQYASTNVQCHTAS